MLADSNELPCQPLVQWGRAILTKRPDGTRPCSVAVPQPEMLTPRVDRLRGVLLQADLPARAGVAGGGSVSGVLPNRALELLEGIRADGISC